MKYKEGDYNCEICDYLGNFNNGDMFGVGKNNMEKFLCNKCLNREEKIIGNFFETD